MEGTVGYVLNETGPLWLVAVAGMFISAVCESARPKPEAGEEKPRGLPLLIAGIASLVTPVLLFAHAFWSAAQMEGVAVSGEHLLQVIAARQVIVIGVFAFLAGVAIAGSIVGWIIRASAPGLGKALNVAAVPLAVATLALAIVVSHQAATGFFVLLTSG